jgi:hypothetical protein
MGGGFTMYRRAFIPLVFLSCAGCVSVFEGTSQDISVNTTPSNATCMFEREGRSIGSIAKTPGTLTVRKNKYDITIKCDKPGYETASYINHSGTSGTIAANVAVDLLLTAGISSIVDSANGADNKYEPVVNIMLPLAQAQTSQSQPVAQPVLVQPENGNSN